MQVKGYNGILTGFEEPIEVALISITDIGEIGEEAFAGDFFEEIEKISFKESVDMVLLHIRANNDDVAFITALALDRIRAYARKCGRYDICVCLDRPSAQEFRSGSCWTKSFSVPYRRIRLRGKVSAEIFAANG